MANSKIYEVHTSISTFGGVIYIPVKFFVFLGGVPNIFFKYTTEKGIIGISDKIGGLGNRAVIVYQTLGGTFQSLTDQQLPQGVFAMLGKDCS